jgi:hypothetical protein
MVEGTKSSFLTAPVKMVILTMETLIAYIGFTK